VNLSAVVPAKAGTHTPQQESDDGRQPPTKIIYAGVMGPRLREDDTGYFFPDCARTKLMMPEKSRPSLPALLKAA
jgi:hypothetical protein